VVVPKPLVTRWAWRRLSESSFAIQSSQKAAGDQRAPGRPRSLLRHRADNVFLRAHRILTVRLELRSDLQGLPTFDLSDRGALETGANRRVCIARKVPTRTNGDWNFAKNEFVSGVIPNK
jgi:hypothetical protein